MLSILSHECGESCEYTTRGPGAINAGGKLAKSLFAVLAIFASLLHITNEQTTRVSKVYPQPTTAVPLQFVTPSYNGIYLSSVSVYIHGEYASVNGNIRSARKDGSLVQNLQNAATNAFDLAKVDDYLVSFGTNADIVLINLQYQTTNFYIYVSTHYPSHNLGLKRALAEANTSNIYVTTSTGGRIHKFVISNLNAVSNQNVFPSLSTSTIDTIMFLDSTHLLFGGSSGSLVVALSSTLAQISSNPGPTQVFKILKDTLSYNSDPVIDLAENNAKQITRYNWTASGPVSVMQKSFNATITNMVEFMSVNYLVVTYGTYMELVKRTNYTGIQTFTMTGVMVSNSIACCSFAKFKYTFSGAFDQTTPAQTIFTTYTINIDFCNTYSGNYCTDCMQNFKLSNNSENNTCISPEEFPPKYGVKGTSIAACTDPKCLRCLNAYFKCEACPANLFLNMATFECSDLANVTSFGRDLTNSSIIRRCLDSDCMDCNANYLLCNSCPIEYFTLQNFTCKRKENNFTLEKSYFDADQSKFYFKMSAPFVLDPKDIYPSKLALTITDYKGDTFSDYETLSVTTNDAKDTIIVAMNFDTSIYNATLTIVQKSDKSLFYNSESYMSVNDEMNVTEIRMIKSSAYFTIGKMESVIQNILWPVSFLSIVLGTSNYPWFASLLMRTISVCNVIGHMNGPNLHASDLFFFTVGRTSIPLKLSFLTTAKEDQHCIPPMSYTKVFGQYYSCSIIDLYGSSLFFFLILCLISLPLAYKAYTSNKLHRQKQVTDPSYSYDIGVAQLQVFDRYFGLRMLLVIFEATMAITLQYSMLSIFNEGSPVISDIVGAVIIGLSGALGYCLFRFIYNYLDIQQMKILKAETLALREYNKEHGVSETSKVEIVKSGAKTPGKASGFAPKTKDLSKVFPKKGAPIVIGNPTAKVNTEPFVKVERPVVKDQFEAEIEIDNGGLAQAKDLPLGGTVEQRLVNSRYTEFPAMDFAIIGYKKDVRQMRSLFYYFALLEVLNTIVGQFVLVRFADGGMVQVYILVVFEMLLLGLTTYRNPYEKKQDFSLFLTYKILVLLIYTLKLINFISMKEQTARQNFLDSTLLVLGIILVVFATVMSIWHAVIGVKTLLATGAAVSQEIKFQVVDKKEVQDKIEIGKKEDDGFGLDESLMKDFVEFDKSPEEKKKALEKKAMKSNKPTLLVTKAPELGVQAADTGTNLNSPQKIVKKVVKNTLSIEPTKTNILQSEQDELKSPGAQLRSPSRGGASPGHDQNRKPVQQIYEVSRIQENSDSSPVKRVDRIADQLHGQALTSRKIKLILDDELSEDPTKVFAYKSKVQNMKNLSVWTTENNDARPRRFQPNSSSLRHFRSKSS